MKNQNILRSTAALTISGILAKSIDFVFRTYYSRRLGSEGLGLFSLVFSLHGLLLNLSTAGLGVAVSTIVSEQFARGHFANIKRTMTISLRAVALLSGAVILTATAFSPQIAKSFLNEPRCARSIAALSPSILFMGISYCIKGYFYAARQIAAPASSEFLEQAVKIISIKLLLDKMLPLGTEHGCEAVFWGITLGELSSCSFLCISYLLHRRTLDCKSRFESNLGFKLLKIAFPVMLTSLAGSFLRMKEEVLVVSSLIKYGLNRKVALSLYGSVHGMALPLIIFPLTLFSSCFTLLVPEITRAKESASPVRLKTLISKIYRFTACFGFLITTVMWLFSEQLCSLIYNDHGLSQYLLPLSLLAPIMFMDSVSCRFLNGMGKNGSLLFYSLSDSALRILLIWLFMPRFGINGLIGVMFFSNFLTFSLTLRNVMRTSSVSFEIFGWSLKHLVSFVTTYFALNGIWQAVSLSDPFKTVLCIGFAAATYLLTSVFVSKVTRRDFFWLYSRLFFNA